MNVDLHDAELNVQEAQTQFRDAAEATAFFGATLSWKDNVRLYLSFCSRASTTTCVMSAPSKLGDLITAWLSTLLATVLLVWAATGSEQSKCFAGAPNLEARLGSSKGGSTLCALLVNDEVLCWLDLIACLAFGLRLDGGLQILSGMLGAGKLVCAVVFSGFSGVSGFLGESALGLFAFISSLTSGEGHALERGL